MICPFYSSSEECSVILVNGNSYRDGCGWKEYFPCTRELEESGANELPQEPFDLVMSHLMKNELPD